MFPVCGLKYVFPVCGLKYVLPACGLKYVYVISRCTDVCVASPWTEVCVTSLWTKVCVTSHILRFLTIVHGFLQLSKLPRCNGDVVLHLPVKQKLFFVALLVKFEQALLPGKFNGVLGRFFLLVLFFSGLPLAWPSRYPWPCGSPCENASGLPSMRKVAPLTHPTSDQWKVSPSR